MQKTVYGEKLKEYRAQLAPLQKDLRHLEKVRNISPEVKRLRVNEIKRLRAVLAEKKPLWKARAKLEAITVIEQIMKRSNNREYRAYYAYWRVNGKNTSHYLGMVHKISEEQAYQKALKLKKQSLGLIGETRPIVHAEKKDLQKIVMSRMVIPMKPDLIGRSIAGENLE